MLIIMESSLLGKWESNGEEWIGMENEYEITILPSIYSIYKRFLKEDVGLKSNFIEFSIHFSLFQDFTQTQPSFLLGGKIDRPPENFDLLIMEVDPFGFIDETCRIPEAQELILREFPFARRSRGDRKEEEESQEPHYRSTLTESTNIVMMSLPETQDGEVGEGEEEYHTPPENSSAVPSSDEAAGVGVDRTVDLAGVDEVVVWQDVVGLGKSGGVEKLTSGGQKSEKIWGSRRKEGSLGSVREELFMLGSLLELDGGNAPDSRVLELGQASKGKNVNDECLQEYLATKLKKVDNKSGIVSRNEHSNALDAGLVETDPEMQDVRFSKEDDASWGSRRLDSPEKARVDIGYEASGGELDCRLKRRTVADMVGRSLVDNSGKRMKSLESRGNRDMVKDVNGNSKADDLDIGLKESPGEGMKILEVSLQVETPSDSVRIVERKIRELLKFIEKPNQQEVIAEGSSMRGNLNEKSLCADTIRIIGLEVSERHDGLVVGQDVENAASRWETSAGYERSKNLGKKKSIEEIENSRFSEKSSCSHDKGKRKCHGEGTDMLDLEADKFEICDSIARKISRSKEGIVASPGDVLSESSKHEEGLRKLPPSMGGKLADKDSRNQSQDTVPPRPVASPQEDGVGFIASAKSDAPPPPKVKVPHLLKVARVILDARGPDTTDIAESLSDIVKRAGMNLPRPKWWPENNFELG